MDLQPILERRGQIEAFQRKHRIGLLTLLFTDIVGSTRLKQDVGDADGFDFIQRHHSLVRDVLAMHPEGEEISTAGDSFFLVFAKPSEAVKFALLLQSRLRDEAQRTGTAVFDRIGIHIGEVIIDERPDLAKPKDLYGMQVDICARVMSAGTGDQILMTRSAFDNARQVIKGNTVNGLRNLVWLNHGTYTMQGVEEPLEICEVGEEGLARLQRPDDSSKIRRFVSAGSDSVTRAGTDDLGARSSARPRLRRVVFAAAMIALLVAVVVLWPRKPSGASAEATLERIGFESSEGYSAGKSLIGQRGWHRGNWPGQLESGGEGVDAGLFPGSGQQAFIGGVAGATEPAVHAALGRVLVHSPTAGKAKVQVAWKQMIRPSREGGDNFFEWVFYNQSKQMIGGVMFANASRQVWRRLADNTLVGTPVSFKQDQVIDVILTLDLQQNSWSGSIGGETLPPQPIVLDNRPLNLGAMALTWRSIPKHAKTPGGPVAGDNLMAFDDFVVTVLP